MRQSSLPGVTNLIDILNNPNGVGGQKPAPDPVVSDKPAPKATKGRSVAVPERESVEEAAKVCVTYGDDGQVLFYLDDDNDYEKVVDLEVDMDTAKELIPFLQEIAFVRVLHRDLKAEFAPNQKAKKK